MSRPLPTGDPTRLGPFRLSARLLETPAGIVYLGEDDDGRQVTVAVLTRGAAQDAAARDRFRAAILSAVPQRGPDGRPQAREAVPVAGGAPVVAAQPEGPAPWVATLYRPGYEPGAVDRAGAERFLDPVVLRGALRSRLFPRPVLRRGPGFQPYWSGLGRGPAVGRPPAPAPAPPAGPRSDRGLIAAILTLVALLGLLAVLMLMLFACQPVVQAPPPDPPSDTYTPPTPPPPRSPPPSSPSPTPSGSPPSISPPPGEDPGDPGL